MCGGGGEVVERALNTSLGLLHSDTVQSGFIPPEID